MSTYTTHLELDEYKNSGTNSDEFNQIANCLPDKEIYAKLGGNYKGGAEAGFDKNLLSSDEAKTHLQSGGNIGIGIGKHTGYVAIDVERQGALNEAQSIVDKFSVATWDSAHIGRNRLLKVADADTFDLLDSYNDDAVEDLEIITDLPHIVIPPTSIDHRTCEQSKQENYDCPGVGQGHYELVSVNPEAEEITKDEAEKVGDLLGIEPEDTTDDGESTDVGTGIGTSNVTDETVPDPSPTIDYEKEFDKHVFSVNHDFKDRYEYLFNGDWDGVEDFKRMYYHGDFTSIPGSNNQGPAECKIANTVGFFFGRNEDLIRFFMDGLTYDTQYQSIPSHRHFILKIATEGPIYHEGVSYQARRQIADNIYIEEETTVKELEQLTDYSDRHIRTVINLFEAEKVIEIKSGERRKRTVINDGIDEAFLSEVDSLFQDNGMKYVKNEYETPENVDRVSV